MLLYTLIRRGILNRCVFCKEDNMWLMKLIVAALALLGVCSGYRCPSDGSKTYHGDLATGCQVYHVCENSRMQFHYCPGGQAFDHLTNECKDESLVECIETAPHHLQKRSLEEIHSVSVEQLKTSTKESLKAIKSLAKNTLQETLPDVYNRIEKDLVPIFNSLKSELEPIFEKQVIPRLEKFYLYAKRLEEKILKKLYRSYELSNSTHLNVVSFDDVMDQVFTDLKPILNLGKFLSLRLMKNSRIKREVSTFAEEHLLKSAVGVHSIDKKHLENSLKEIFKAIISLAKTNLQEILPTLYNRIERQHFPVVQSFVNDMEPMFKKMVLPRIEKIHIYAKEMGDKIIKKIYQSYELTNSTHINVVSCQDITEQLLIDVKPFLNLGKFLSARLMKQGRFRRDIEENQPKRTFKVHSIPIEHLKNSTKEIYKSIQMLSKTALQETLPTIYNRIQREYAPVIKNFKSDIEPIFRKQILPQIERFIAYAKNMGNRIVKKSYQSYELSNSTHLNVVTFDDVINDILADSKPYLNLERYFSSRTMKHLRFRRDTGYLTTKETVEEIHSLSIETLKNSAEDLIKSMKSLLRETLQDLLPSVYTQIKNDYAPIIEFFKNDLEPLFHKKVFPHLLNLRTYAKVKVENIVKKIYRTYELSNSTYLNIVSFDDVIDEIFTDIKPFLNYGRYLSSAMMKTSRVKRDTGVPITDVPELLLGYLEPALKDLFASVTGMFSMDDNTLTSRVIMPTLLDIMNNPETMNYVKKVFWSSKAAFSPLIFDMLNRQSFYNPDGTIIRIPKQKLEAAKKFFYKETKPLIVKIAENHLNFFFYRISENTKLIFDAVDRIKYLTSTGNGLVLKEDIVRFIQKHFKVWESTSSAHVRSYTLSEIKQDLRPIEMGILQLALDYVDQQENSWLKIFFGRDSILTRAVFGERETYAVPSGGWSGIQTRPTSQKTVPSRSSQPYRRPTSSKTVPSSRPAFTVDRDTMASLMELRRVLLGERAHQQVKVPVRSYSQG